MGVMGALDPVVVTAQNAASRLTAAVSGLEIGEKVQVWVVSPVVAGAEKVPALVSGAAAAAGQVAVMTGDLLAVYVVSPASKGGDWVLELVSTMEPRAMVDRLTSRLLAALATVQKTIEPATERVLAVYFNLKGKAMLTGLDFLFQSPQARLAAQATCAAGALVIARKIYHGSSPPAVPQPPHGAHAKGYVDSETLKEREDAGRRAIEGVGVEPGGVVMVATQLLEAVEVYSYCAAANAKAVVFAPGQSTEAVTAQALAQRPAAFVYDVRALPGVAGVEAAMRGAGIACRMVFVAGSERERERVLAEHPSHVALDRLVEEGGAAAARSVRGGGGAAARGPQAPVPNFIAEFNQGVQALGNLFAGKAPPPPLLKTPAPATPEEKDVVIRL